VNTNAQHTEAKYADWARFVSAHSRPFVASREQWTMWMAGESRPTINAVHEMAIALGVPESDIMAATGRGDFETAAAFLNARKQKRQAANNVKHRAKWASDEAYRLATIARCKEYAKAHPRTEVGPQTIRNRKLWAMSEAERREYIRKIKRANRQKNEPPAGRSMAWVHRQLDYIRQRLDRIDARLSRPAITPWHKAGFITQDAWYASGGSEARQHQLAYWKARTYMRRDVLLDRGGTWTRDEWIAKMKQFGYRCAYCGMHRREQRARYKTDMEVDHVLPLSRGGSNHLWNIVPACKGCNSSKGDRHILEWALKDGNTLHPLVIEAHVLEICKLNGISRATCDETI
jgi:hypothetical protein